jgi:hypothetical protein
MISGNISLETDDAIVEIGNNVFLRPGQVLFVRRKLQ